MVKRRRGKRLTEVPKEVPSQSWRCRLSLYLGRDKLRIADVERMTGIHRNTLYRLYHEKMRLVDMEEISVLCKLFNVSIAELFEPIAEPPVSKKPPVTKISQLSESALAAVEKKSPAKKKKPRRGRRGDRRRESRAAVYLVT